MKRNNKWFWISPIIFGTTVLATIRIINDVPRDYKFWQRPLSVNIIEFVSIIIISFGLEYFLQQFVKRNKSAKEMSIRHLVFEYLMMMMFGIVLTLPILYGIHYMTDSPVTTNDIVIAEVSMTLLIIIYYSIFRGGDLLQGYVDQKILTQQIRNTQMETELKFLKAQFHPHFLFNALNAIYFQIDENNEAPRKSIELLSDLLRYQLYDINQTVSIEQEFNFIRNYIEFQKVRMNESFQLTASFDPNLSDRKIHPLLMFPLVENAYKYVGGAYWIKIEARLQQDGLSFVVENAIPQIQQSTNKKAAGIGLENLRRRLDLLYPGKYFFDTRKTNHSFIANLKIEC
ncbi:MAG: sensor histidine kinase [Bacteroidales bacterium]|nr:sensor histidine kinase [Bacteroidales bacterium]